ncbi:MAG: ribosomal protection-like ABC-F family protein [Peptococcaceae bacterium]
MSQIRITDLSFTHENSYIPVFEHVSLQLDTDWKLGFTGRNGRGKTTFLKLLAGQYPYQGSISASVQFDYFPFPVAEPHTMVLDLLEELTPQAELWQIRRELSLLDVTEEVYYRPFSTLSGGEQTKVLLAALFLRENHFLLIDEPTNHLDQTGRQLVSRYLSRKKGFILVSHDRRFLDGAIDHILSINKSNIELQEGNFSSWYANKQRQDQFELAQNARLKKEISRLTETAREKAAWSDQAEQRKTGIDPLQVDVKFGYAPKQAAKAKKQMARAKAIQQRQQRAIAEKSALLKNIERVDDLKLSPLPAPAQRLVSLREVSILYDAVAVNQPLTLEIMAGERIALQGVNGSGKSSILNLIAGAPLTHSGTIDRNSRLQIACVSQMADHLAGSLREYAQTQQIDLSQFMTILSKLGLSAQQMEQPMQYYSMGQKKKVLLAACLCQRAHLYLWDEPMNYLDIDARLQLEDMLLQAGPTMLFVEHDQAFTEKIATQTITLHPAKQVRTDHAN